MTLACVNGELLPVAEATIPVTDDGLLRGDGVFEVLRLYAGRPFALAAHLDRLARSAANLRLPVDLDAMRGDVTRLLDAAGAPDGLLRVVATRGGARLVLIEPLADHPDALRLGFVTYAPTRVLDQVKSLSYAGNMLATRLARERGFDEALLVTPHGRVLEGPTSSFFWVRDGRLLTPPLEDHILASITRARVVELTGAEEATCTGEDVERADEAFLASTTREVTPVAAIESHELAPGGPVTTEAARLLRERIEAELGGA
jgi:branched-chain amino acid aminotransferase